MKRRNLVRRLEAAGFKSEGGANHEQFTNGKVTVSVPRHREVNEITAKEILKKAGLA